jgi:hypothetical protein
MKIRLKQDIARVGDLSDLKAGQIIDVDRELGEKLIRSGLAEEVPLEFVGEEVAKKVEAEAKEPRRTIILKQSTRVRGQWLPAGTYRVPDELSWELSQWLLDKQLAEEISVEVGKPAAHGTEEEVQVPPPAPVEGGGPQKKVEIPPELAGWLSSKGFVLNPEGVAFVRTERLETGDIVKLLVDFTDTPKGTRFGYRLDLSKDPPEWKPDKALRDHPLLLEFKAFRDKLLAERAKVAPPAKPIEVPTKEGAVVTLLPPEVEEAKEVERRDEEMIIREVKGDMKILERALADYFYSFELRGRKVIGLSYAGVKAIIRRMGHVEIQEIKVEEKPKSWFVLVKARDKLRDLEAYGAAVQPKQFPSGEENPFALTIAVSKAQRNAWRHFIDERVVTEAYRAWLERREEYEG